MALRVQHPVVLAVTVLTIVAEVLLCPTTLHSLAAPLMEVAASAEAEVHAAVVSAVAVVAAVPVVVMSAAVGELIINR